MLRILVALPINRELTGELTVFAADGTTLFGPVECAGTASSSDAAAHDNPKRLPDLPFGHSPLGNYIVDEIITMEGATNAAIQQFGRYGCVMLRIAGSSEDASNPELSGREICIHGSAPGDRDTLATTNGSIRLHAGDCKELVSLLMLHDSSGEQIACECKEVQAGPNASLVEDKPCLIGESPRRSLKGMLTKLSLLSTPFIALPYAFAQSGSCCSSGSSELMVPAKHSTAKNVSFEVPQVESRSFSRRHLLIQEGGVVLNGYVPRANAGVTIAGGLDFGFYTAAQLSEMGFPDESVRAWSSYLAPSATEPLIGKAAEAALRVKPLTVSAVQARHINRTYFKWNANQTEMLFDRLSGEIGNQQRFVSLPRRWRTALVSMFLADKQFKASRFLRACCKGSWAEAMTALTHYGSIRASVNQRAYQNHQYLSRTNPGSSTLQQG